MLPFERQRSLPNAYESMKTYIEDRGWLLEWSAIGSDIVTTTCLIREADGTLVAGGYGKGGEDISRVGAMYEAVEHHYGLLNNIDIEVACVRAEVIHADVRFAGLPVISELFDQKDRHLACAFYEDFHSGASVCIPLFLVFPHYVSSARVDGDDFDYSVVGRYGSNSGTAIGGSFEEAAIHALNEIVERDAWSLFLLSHFMDTAQKIGRVIDTATVPDDMKQLLAIARDRASGRDIVLIDITSDIGIPTFAATVDGILPEELLYPGGFGSSTYPYYAAYRAITELIQIIDLKKHSEETRRIDRTILAMVSGYRKIRDCAYFEVDSKRLARGTWDYPDQTNRSLAAVLSDILLRLQAHGIDVCFNTHCQVADSFCVVSCVSMTLERFFMVSSGQLMAPGVRGLKLFAQGHSSEPGSRRTDGEPLDEVVFANAPA